MSVIEQLPLFPLALVLYPNERLPLHIFEPRYQALIAQCIEHDVPFGVLLEQEGALAEVGCTARVRRVVARYEDGRMDIVAEGEQRFRVVRVRQEAAYLTADVAPINEPREVVASELTERAITQHMKLLELAGRTVRPSLYQHTRQVSYVMAHNAGLTLEQKVEVLAMPSENDRIAFLVRHFEVLIPRIEQQEDFRRRVRSNGHFRDFPPEEG